MSANQTGSWRSVWRLVFAYWRSNEKIAAYAMLIAIVGLSLGMVYMNVQINHWQNTFFNALEGRHEAELYFQLLRFLLLAAVWVVMSVYSQYLTQMLQIQWRRWLTEHYLEKWLDLRAYYRLQFEGSRTDNPDQRIADDIRAFVEDGTGLFLGVLNASVTLVSFVGILWALSGPLVFQWHGMTITIPGYIVWVAVLYALAGNLMTHVIGKPLVGLNFARQRVEADFRYSLVRFRDMMEGVAFNHGEAGEVRGFRARFAQIVSNWWTIMRRQKNLAWFTSSYGQLAVVVPFAVAAPRFLSGAMPLGGLMQTVNAFGYVRDSLSWFMNAYVALATWRASVDRLTGFNDAIDIAHEKQRADVGVTVTSGPGTSLVLENVALDRPAGTPLLGSLNAQIDPGFDLLVCGPSGAGKTTLLRAIAGIWPFGRGSIRTPPAFKALFLTQTPYFPLGTLRDALCYPASSDHFTDEQVREVLQAMGLARLAGALDAAGNWPEGLSGADKQRVAVARALLHQPAWLFLDEATTELDDASQESIYQLLHLRLPDTTLVSIGGREALQSHHLRRWEFRHVDSGRYEVTQLDRQPA